MDNLTIALACAGGVVLAAVVAHGAWQARKAGPLRPAQPVPPPADLREPGLHVEPSLDGGDAPGPLAAGAGEPGASVDPLLMPRRSTARIDALIDGIATLTVESPVSGDMALSHLPPSRRAGTKPFLIEGVNTETGEWELPLPGRRYSEFQAGVQLANRTGPLNEIEFSEFVQKVQEFADLIGALVDFPDMLDVVGRARELDAFASQHDAQLAVHLNARLTAWSVGYIQQHAGRHGFVQGLVPGRLVLPSAEEGAPPMLVLSFGAAAALADDPNRAAVRDITLSFDVPQTEAAADPFAAWQASAQALALGMDAAIVDDNGHALSAQGFAAIGQELNQLYRALEARDLSAGSLAARRLFS